MTADRLPSMAIQRAVARLQPDTCRWSGSDLPDAYLMCLSPYAGIVYVDKRTHEALRVSRSKLPSLKSLFRHVERAKHYTDIATQLS